MSDTLKIFDFNSKIAPCGIVGKVMELGWPCMAYRVTLPNPRDAELAEFNVFERCILKILACGRYERKELAEETCIPSDLIELILLKLRDRVKIDAQNQLLPGVREALEKDDNERDSAPMSYETCVIFRECIGGALLPMVVNAKMRSEEVNEDHTIGRGHIPIRSFAQSSIETQPPLPVEVLNALRTMARRRRASRASFRIPPAKHVSVGVEGESCWLRVRVVMQRNGDWRILNPFGDGWSTELETVYRKVIRQGRSAEVKEFNSWQHRNADWHHERRIGGDEGRDAPFATGENVSRYPELIAVLKRKQEGGVVDVYAAIEWALFYALGRVDVKGVEQLLSVRTRGDSLAWLKKSLIVWRDEKVWQQKDDDATRMICAIPTESGLQRFYEGAASMQTVLPLAVLVAAREPRSVFYRLAVECPRLLPKIADLKARRDPKRHGKGKWNEIYGEEDMRLMRRVVTTVLPSVRFSEVARSVSDAGEDDGVANDARISARVALQDVFGVSAFEFMDARLRDILINAEVFRRDHVDDEGRFDALCGVNELYAAAQSAFRPLLIGGRRDSSAADYAARRAVDAGFGPLPSSLKTVRESMLSRTLDGDDQTLQACAVAWLIVTDDDILSRVAARMPSFLADIDKLIALDGHGNQSISMCFGELDSLCENVYNIIKILTEV